MKLKIAFIPFIILSSLELSADESGSEEKSNDVLDNIEFMPGEGVIIEKLQKFKAVGVNLDYQNRLLTVVDADDAQLTFTITQAVDVIYHISNADSVAKLQCG